jgi:hypothetical protein
MARPVEEAEVGVAVQLGIVHGGLLPDDRGRLVELPLAGPGRGVATIAVVDRDRVVHDRVGTSVGPGRESVRSSSDHGTGGLFQPISVVLA